MKYLIKDKRGDGSIDDPLLYILLITVVGIIIAISVAIFFSVFIDVRADESITIANKLSQAIIVDGNLDKDLLDKGYSIFTKSGLNEKMFSSAGIYYFNATIFEGNKGVISFVNGKNSFEVECKLPGENFPKCTEKIYTIYDLEKNKIYKVNIFAGSNQQGKRL